MMTLYSSVKFSSYFSSNSAQALGSARKSLRYLPISSGRHGIQLTLTSMTAPAWLDSLQPIENQIENEKNIYIPIFSRVTNKYSSLRLQIHQVPRFDVHPRYSTDRNSWQTVNFVFNYPYIFQSQLYQSKESMIWRQVSEQFFWIQWEVIIQSIVVKMNAGFALIALGLSIKGGLRMYRYIRKREFIDPLRMYPGGFYATMNRREAQLILGVGEGADTGAIKQKHRTLMLNNHPDNQGSTFLATKINEAKQLLINE